MSKNIQEISEKLCGRKTILLPTVSNANCYAIYSKETYEGDVDKKLCVDGKAYKHRLYFYKKLNNASDKILTFIFLNPGYSNHINQTSDIKKCEEIAQKDYGAIEIFSIFTLRTLDKIDSVSENAILDVVRADLSKNDIVLVFDSKLKRTKKYEKLSVEDLKKINKVINHKVNDLLSFIYNQKNRNNKIYVIGLTKLNNPKTIASYKGQALVEYNYNSDI